MSDTAPPTLASLTVPGAVNLNVPNPSATFSLAATDDSSGVNQAVIFFDHAISTKDSQGNVSTVSGISLTSNGNGTFSSTLQLSGFAGGTYHVSEAQLKDNAGNLH